MRSTSKWIGCVSAMVLTGVYAAAPVGAFAADEPKVEAKETAKEKAKELAGLLGKWKVKAIQQGGKDAVEKAPEVVMIIKPDGKMEGELPNGSFKATYRLDVESTPKQLDIKHETGPYAGEPQFCSYKLDDDTLILLATHPGAEANDRPVDFDTERSFVFERVKETK